ncbi:YdcH family protein [Cohaesibacter celericrescens]|uniref:DUF465 domain-containing protein n=1 Tax=Cohaesibacter celericrescens TaxID=2067669 RepID=A0A2N5XLD2_9HYPH|nr:DUF465 domain-containing protein [Cohaesibacter celericrescens]PLW75248.1 hypothetical protein C0081_20755 [Cohaesibacter celericrescens]
MTPKEEEEIRAKMAQLKTEHSDLDIAIQAMVERPGGNALPIQRMKKKKLSLKDDIQRLENRLFPDIIA